MYVQVATVLGILIGAMVRNVELAVEIAPAIFVPLMLFSGYTNNTKNIVAWLRWLERISPTRYFFEFLVTNEFEDRDALGDTNPIKTLNFTFGLPMTIGVLASIYFALSILSFILLPWEPKKEPLTKL